MSSQAAFRMLSQATFGPTPASINDLASRGLGPWIDAQIAAPWTPIARTVEAWSGGPTNIERRTVQSAIMRAFFTSEAQLRWRVAYALSQIFVTSLDSAPAFVDPLGYADYFDTLAQYSFGNYRQLLEAVALHPAMGNYLSHMRNLPANDKTGRVPDENFAREIMQLFSIGLHQLRPDGTPRRDGEGNLIPTYGPDDVTGLAHVFTGWSWDCLNGDTETCFWRSIIRMPDPRAGTRQMIAYPQFHSTAEKRFLGTVIPAQSTPNPQASLRIALDTISNHPNVAPFITRQLIQRLVTSNPSPAYVAAVAAVFNDNGRGVRGDLAAVVRAILSHPDATVRGATSGKIREPLLRFTAFGRAFQVRSISGEYRTWFDESDKTAMLGQWPFKAPSVFNYYRPNYKPPNGRVAATGGVAPEMQITDETAVASHIRFMRAAIEEGYGLIGSNKLRDIQFNFDTARSLAGQPEALVDHVFSRLLGDDDYPALRTEVIQAVRSITIPTSLGWNQSQIDSAKRDRARTALLLTVAAPEFIIQK
jgi:uncharacterized protein (DUF1800 family)